MNGTWRRYGRLLSALLAGAFLVLWPAGASAQRHEHDGGGEKGSASGGWGHDGYVGQLEPQPYGGQIYCPVTGKKLGLSQAPVAVQTTIGALKPSWFGKLLGEKPKPGTVIYVCCPSCAEQVRQNPRPYLEEVIADRGCFTFTYGKAPAQRPARAALTTDPSHPPVATGTPNAAARVRSAPP